jgi:hypothetical protein
MNSTAKFHATEALDRDAATFIALWLQIYGGDPPPQQVEATPATGMIAAAMVTQLRNEYGASTAPLSDSELAGRLARLGLELGQSDERGRSTITIFNSRFYCVKGPDGEPGCCVGIPFRITEE